MANVEYAIIWKDFGVGSCQNRFPPNLYSLGLRELPIHLLYNLCFSFFEVLRKGDPETSVELFCFARIPNSTPALDQCSYASVWLLGYGAMWPVWHNLYWFRPMLASFLHHFPSIGEQFWKTIGQFCSILDYFWIISGSFWDHVGTILGKNWST